MCPVDGQRLDPADAGHPHWANRISSEEEWQFWLSPGKSKKTSPIMGDGVLPRRAAVSYGINPRNVNSENVS